MPILFRCEHCRQKLSISSRKGGTMLKCPKCAQDILVPIPEAKIVAEEDKPQETEPRPTQEPESPAKKSNNAEIDAWAKTRELPERRESLAETAPLEPSFSPSLEPPPKTVQPFPKPAPAAKAEAEDEFTLRRPKTELDEMDLTPMVDVTFLLLIFFMITASFSLTKTIETPAPDPEDKGAQLQNLEELEMTSIMARIDEQDNIFLDDDPVDAADLEIVLGDKLRQEQKNELVIQASPLCRHETFVNLFDAATGAGMQRIRLAAVRSED